MKIDELTLGGMENPATTPTTLSGPGTTSIGDPRMQAAMLTKQKQDVSAQRKAIQDRIAELDREKESLRKQLATLR